MSVHFQQELPILRDVDVVVVGAGPAGLGAAIAAARGGAKTLVFDAAGCIGGMATNGGVGPFMTSFDSKGEHMVIRGIFEELVNRMEAVGGAIQPAKTHNGDSYASYLRLGHNNVGPFKSDAFKLVGTRMLRESGAELMLHTQFVQVLLEGSRITGVVVANKDGLGVIQAKVVIDCSGDADVAARAGVPFVIGDRETGNIQPATLFFRVGNVDTAKVTENMKAHWDEIRPFYGPFSWLLKQYAEDWNNFPRGEIGIYEEVDPGVFRVNCSRILDVDATKTDDLTRATEIGQEQCLFIFRFLKKHAPGFENAVLLNTADTIGIRETRHIQGEYTLTGKEVYDCVLHPDAIACMATCMDTHNKDNPGGTLHVPDKPYFDVPYGCLVAKGVENLLVAGRAISADAKAGSAIRMMPSCMAFGQAAGTAAAMAVKAGLPVRQVPTDGLRENLTRQGAFVGV